MYLPHFIGIDFETYCEESIRARGIYNYATHPSFRPILVSLVAGGTVHGIMSYDLTDPAARKEFLDSMENFIDKDYIFAAHNAAFDRLCCAHFGLFPRMVDTAVLCRANGAASSLANATLQLGVGYKLAEGKDLIKKFCLPMPDGTALVDHRDEWAKEDWADWNLFIQYCNADAASAIDLVTDRTLMSHLYTELTAYERLTAVMNERGWPVDLALVEIFEQQAKMNKEKALKDFRTHYDPKGELNLNSHVQLKKWCKKRGVIATSFDEQHVSSMLDRIDKRIDKLLSMPLPPPMTDLYSVWKMLRTKQIVGGSSLKKLPVIKRLVSKDGRLRGQYVHVGAGQSYRTSGTGAQMQNLPRLNGEPGDVTQAHTWTNDQLAHNLRQCFVASHPDGELIVCDLASIESRGLAYLAGEFWKLNAYAKKQDLYKVLARNIYNTDYHLITKDQRQTGKVGELSCGYGAGAGAVQSFANKMGVEMSEQAAENLVTDWRAQCPRTVELWNTLNELLHEAVKHEKAVTAVIGDPTYADRITVQLAPRATPASLSAINPRAVSIELSLFVNGQHFLSRVFHGCYYRGRDICYYKATDRKTGPLWSDTYRNPKTKQLTYNKLYGGKLTGILVQSFCRQLFFRGMSRVHQSETKGFELIGQFHDELIVDWWPATITKELAMSRLRDRMVDELLFKEMPIEAEVKAAYRYIK